MPEPDEPQHPESFRLKVPLAGSLSVSGRDVMLLALLTAVGSGLIGMQLYTFRSFQREVASEVRLLHAHIEKGQEDRDRILMLLRLRICSDLPSPPPHLKEVWTQACGGQSQSSHHPSRFITLSRTERTMLSHGISIEAAAAGGDGEAGTWRG